MSSSSKRSYRVRDLIRDRHRPYADNDVLVLEDVARILRCDVDTVRRIPRTLLKARKGPGRFRLYLRSDVLAYIEALPVAGLVDEADEPSTSAILRGRPATFDPSLMIRALGKAGHA